MSGTARNNSSAPDPLNSGLEPSALSKSDLEKGRRRLREEAKSWASEYHDDMSRTLWGILKTYQGDDDPEDLVQESLRHLYTYSVPSIYPRSGTMETGELTLYLKQCARRAAYKTLTIKARKSLRFGRVVNLDQEILLEQISHDTRADDPDAACFRQIVREAVAQLPIKLRRTIVAVILDGESVKTFAEREGIGEPAVRTRLRVARDKLGVILKNLGFAQEDCNG